MKKIERLLKGHKSVVFLDFEGTQFSHEMIAMGAVVCSLDHKTNQIKKMKKPFRMYVKSKEKIGNYVTELTGITQDLLKEKGVTFHTAMTELKKYCGLAFKKASFITFGNHDMRILSQSIAHSFDYPKDVCSIIQKNYVDFAVLISEFVKDDCGNPLSLVNYCQLFDVPEAGTAHDPEVDAINLANLYDAFLKNKSLVLEEYKKILKRPNSHYPEPMNRVLAKLAGGENVTADEFENYLKDYIS